MNIPTNPIEILIWIIVIIIVTTIVARLLTAILNRFNRFKDDMTSIYLIRDIIVYITVTDTAKMPGITRRRGNLPPHSVKRTLPA